MTAINNAFQKLSDSVDNQKLALNEFNGLVACLEENEIETIVVNDILEPHTPDSIFPNNWITFHEDNRIAIYPMFAENRRLERKETVLDKIKAQFQVENIIDYSPFEKEERYLEGTGSFVLDRENRIAYACRSPRTDVSLFKDFCKEFNYTPVIFNAADQNGQQIYHTNVMMCVADNFVVINMDCVNAADQPLLKQHFLATDKTVVEISFEQMNHFAGNMLQVENRRGIKFLLLSTQAYHALNADQKTRLTVFNPMIHAPLYTIESNGGGSCRCMMAEIFLSKKV